MNTKKLTEEQLIEATARSWDLAREVASELLCDPFDAAAVADTVVRALRGVVAADMLDDEKLERWVQEEVFCAVLVHTECPMCAAAEEAGDANWGERDLGGDQEEVDDAA